MKIVREKPCGCVLLLTKTGRKKGIDRYTVERDRLCKEAKDLEWSELEAQDSDDRDFIRQLWVEHYSEGSS